MQGFPTVHLISTLPALIFQGRPTLSFVTPHGGIQDTTFAREIPSDPARSLAVWLRLHAARREASVCHMPSHGPIRGKINLHVEAGHPIERDVSSATPSGAPVVIVAFLCVDGRSKPTVPSTFKEVQLHAMPWCVRRSITVDTLLEALSTDAIGRDRVEIEVDAGLHVGVIDVIFDVAAQQVESSFGGHGTSAIDDPTSVHDLNITPSKGPCQVPLRAHANKSHCTLAVGHCQVGG